MRNVTISLQEDLLKAGRNYAREHHTTLNALIRTLLAQTVEKSANGEWLEECFQIADQARASSAGKKWKREELYRV